MQSNRADALVALAWRGEPSARETRLRGASTAITDALRVFTAERKRHRHSALEASLAEMHGLITADATIRRPSG